MGMNPNVRDRAWLLFTVSGTRITGVEIYGEARPTVVNSTMYLTADGWAEAGTDFQTASLCLRRRLANNHAGFTDELRDAMIRLAKTGEYQKLPT